jgi:hypothetical protein
MLKKSSPSLNTLPLKMVCSTVFGRYPKISKEQVFNMIQSDGWMVPYAGHKKIIDIDNSGVARGIFFSAKLNKLILVIANNVYTVGTNLSANKVASIDTSNGDVFMDENDANQIAICDKKSIYILNLASNIFDKALIDFVPGYICFQDGYFIAADLGTNQWRLSALNNGLVWTAAPNTVGLLQTKPDNVVATVRLPGHGNHLLVMGSTVTELWVDVGYKLFPYQRSSAVNIDYGCLNPSTIASGDEFVVWLAINEKSTPVIMLSTGGETKQISNDGINFKLSTLSNPSDAYGFLFKQDGHLFYQLTFPSNQDNLTLLYDFNTGKFFTLCDEYMNHHIARKVVYFNNSHYFISFKDGNLYELNTRYTQFDGCEIPRVIVSESIRMPDVAPFIVNNLTFVMEQGMDEPKLNVDSDRVTIPRVDLSFSIDGGISFSNYFGMQLNPVNTRQNRLIAWGLGRCNEFIPQFRFWNSGRMVFKDGVINIYQ